MQFLYHKDAGNPIVSVNDENVNYLIKVRRTQLGENLALRNLNDENLYVYELSEVGKRTLTLRLQSSKKVPSDIKSHLHLLWAIIEPKIIEKTLPMLNELGVSRISFFYAAFSQGHFKLSLPRMEKILIQSCQQCGRSDLMKLELYKDFDSICEAYTDFYAFDFGGTDICNFTPCENHLQRNKEEYLVRVMVGAEGGFSQKERQRFAKIITLNDTLILKSESASVFIASIAKVWSTRNEVLKKGK
ncbi:16S rRNA (uracil(1498)-N(3))-methyltransferase [Helicobacter sp. MIT 21-1697]|uniref:16S rRNA (uracil(1498)-N(3))-methyltransferase n=1 Tax=Helicobacter sp. MIT 21-1697 TaxID=2993733 RepID=UPI00224A9E34|nr:16S rRNA (uracil(1498)-N(3))-methyltransferase [Helicobacter sp. MIT 21-1697]MCX2717763.1 16S rRNA (uracil(1498)-N(3))-methyltransferase [Helicobacter sp. MIT 21-1697]